MSNVYFTSDWHLFHANIAKFSQRVAFMNEDERDAIWAARGQESSDLRKLKVCEESVHRMNQAIIDNINRVVGRGDTLWVLGDVILGSFDPRVTYNQLREVRDKINCQNINMIWGNHDKPLQWWRGRNKALSRDQFFEIFNKVDSQTRIKVRDQHIVLNHYAMCVWDGSHRGAWHLYGHSHSNFEHWRVQILSGARQFDVGIDAKALVQWYERGGDLSGDPKPGEDIPKPAESYAPWSFDEIKEIMDRRSGLWLDHHVPKRE